MLIETLLIVAVSCEATRVENRTSSWMPDDIYHLNKAREGCLRIYSDRHCLVMFRKTGTLSYHAVCRRTPDVTE